MIVGNTSFLQQLEIGRQTKLSQDIAKAQAQVSGGKRLLAPSDDPVAATQISNIGRQQADSTAFSSNVNAASSLASQADSALANVQNDINRAKELMLAGSNGTPSAEDRASMVLELRSIATDLQNLADSKDSNGNPLFSPTTALSIPVGNGISITPVGSKNQVFGSVNTASGTLDVMTIVSNAADALANSNDSARQTAAAASLDALDDASDHVIEQRSEQGLRAAQLDNLSSRYADDSDKLAEQRSGLEETDLSQALATITSKQVTLQAAQAIYAKLNQQTLFSLLT